MKYSFLLLISALFIFSDGQESFAQKKKPKKKEEKNEQSEYIKSQKFTIAFSEGARQKLIQDYNQAIAHFKACIKIDPAKGAPHFELADIYHLMNEQELALVHARKAAELIPDNYWYQMMYMESLQKLERLEEALEVAKGLIKRFPEKGDLYEGLALLNFYNGKYDKGIEVLNEAEEKFGTSPKIIEARKQAYIFMGLGDKAVEEARKQVASDPSNVIYTLDLVDLLLNLKRNEEALDALKELSKEHPEDGRIHLGLAQIYEQMDDKENGFKSLDKAFKDPALEIDVKMKILLSYFGLINKDDEIKKRVRSLIETLVAVHPEESKAHTIYGDFLYNEKEIRPARTEFKKAVQLDEGRFAIWNQLIIIEAELENYDSVIVVSDQAKELFPNQPSLYYYAGIAYVQLENYKSAVQQLEAGKRMVLNNRSLLLQFELTLGDAYNELEEYKKSDQAFDAALKLDSNNANVLNNYSYYLSLRKENLEKAEKMSKRSNQLAANQPSYLDTYAWIMYQLGKYEEAAKWIIKALDSGGSSSSEVLEHAGDIHYRLNEKDKALEYWKRARDKGEGSPLLENKIRDQQLYE